VDPSTEPFSFGRPDPDGIRKFMKEKVFWSDSKTDEYLVPLLKRMDSVVTHCLTYPLLVDYLT